MERLTGAQQASRVRARARLQKGASARAARAMSFGYDYHHKNDKVYHRYQKDYNTNRPILNESITSYYYNGELVAELTRVSHEKTPILMVFLPSRKGRENRRRIDAILRRVFGYSLRQKKGDWYIARPGDDNLRYTEALEIFHPDRHPVHFWEDAMGVYDY